MLTRAKLKLKYEKLNLLHDSMSGTKKNLVFCQLATKYKLNDRIRSSTIGTSIKVIAGSSHNICSTGNTFCAGVYFYCEIWIHLHCLLILPCFAFDSTHLFQNLDKPQQDIHLFTTLECRSQNMITNIALNNHELPTKFLNSIPGNIVGQVFPFPILAQCVWSKLLIKFKPFNCIRVSLFLYQKKKSLKAPLQTSHKKKSCVIPYFCEVH